MLKSSKFFQLVKNHWWLDPEPKLHKTFILKQIVSIALRLPTRTSVTDKFKDLKIGTIFEYHVYEILEFSINQIRNGFKNVSIGTQNRQTTNKSLSISYLHRANDRPNTCVIILINVQRKLGVLPSDKMICKMNGKQF